MAPSTRAAQRPQALIDMTVGAARHFAEAAGALSARPDTVTFRIPSRPTLIFHSMLSRRSTAFPVPPAASRLAFPISLS